MYMHIKLYMHIKSKISYRNQQGCDSLDNENLVSSYMVEGYQPFLDRSSYLQPTSTAKLKMTNKYFTHPPDTH